MEQFAQHSGTDYPVGVYYVDLEKMYMNRVRWHWHEELEICLVRTGTAILCIGEKQVPIESGDAVLISGNHLHSIQSTDKSCVLLSILFHPDYLFGDTTSFLAAKYGAPVLNDPEFCYVLFSGKDSWGRRGIDSINSILNANLTKAYGYELATKGFLCTFWMQLLEKADIFRKERVSSSLSVMDENRIKDAICYIHENYGAPITLEDIANSIHVSKSECCRCFKRALQISPFDYLLMYRIYESARKMQRSESRNDSIASLSSAVGFNSTSYYNKIFRKYLNCTPTEYREIIKKSHRDSLNPFGIPLARL